MIAKAQFTIKDLNDIWPSPVPPAAIPPVGFMWRNTSVVPNELVAWNGKGTDVARVYSASKNGTSVLIEDLFDDRALGVTVKTVAPQITSVQGKNICPSSIGEWESGAYDATTGLKVANDQRARLNRLIPVTPSTTYYFHGFTNPYQFVVRYYGIYGTFLASAGVVANGGTLTTGTATYFISVQLINNTSETGMTWATWQSLFAAGTVKPFVCLNSESSKTYASFIPPRPSADYPTTISGRNTVGGAVSGRNILNPASLQVAVRNGVTVTYDSTTQIVTFNGTCTTNNTTWAFSPAPKPIDGPHNYSAHFVSGTKSGTTYFQGTIDIDWTKVFAFALPASGKAYMIQTNPAPSGYYWIGLRADAGAVFSNYQVKVQLELGSVASDWEAYTGEEFLLTPDATVYGALGQEDEIGNDGHVVHRTEKVIFDGSADESWLYNSSYPATYAAMARFTLNFTTAASPKGACSHFPWADVPANNTTVEVMGGHTTGASFSVFIFKSRMSGWSDSLTDAQKAALFKTWLSSHAMTVVYQKAAETTATVAPAQIIGTAGMNVVTSDGASAAVTYTGSGWEAVGSVQRVAVESVSITPEEGLRVDTILTNGGTSVSTYFNARGTKYGLFRLSDGEMLQGAKALPGDRVMTVTQALTNPDVEDDSWVEPGMGGAMATEDGFGISIYKNGVKCGGLYGNGSYVAFGQPPNGSSDVGSFSVQGRYPEIRCFKGTNAGGIVQFIDPPVPATSTTMAFQCFADVVPYDNNQCRMGLPGLGWAKYYGYSTSIASTSDEREKHDMRPVDPEMMRRFILALDPTWYRLDAVPDDLMVGFKAQQFKSAMEAAGIPDDYAGFIGGNPDHLCLDYGQVIAPLAAMAKLHELENRERDKLISEQGRQIQALLKRLGAEEDWAQ